MKKQVILFIFISFAYFAVCGQTPKQRSSGKESKADSYKIYIYSDGSILEQDYPKNVEICGKVVALPDLPLSNDKKELIFEGELGKGVKPGKLEDLKPIVFADYALCKKGTYFQFDSSGGIANFYLVYTTAYELKVKIVKSPSYKDTVIISVGTCKGVDSMTRNLCNCNSDPNITYPVQFVVKDEKYYPYCFTYDPEKYLGIKNESSGVWEYKENVIDHIVDPKGTGLSGSDLLLLKKKLPVKEVIYEMKHCSTCE